MAMQNGWLTDKNDFSFALHRLTCFSGVTEQQFEATCTTLLSFHWTTFTPLHFRKFEVPPSDGAKFFFCSKGHWVTRFCRIEPIQPIFFSARANCKRNELKKKSNSTYNSYPGSKPVNINLNFQRHHILYRSWFHLDSSRHKKTKMSKFLFQIIYLSFDSVFYQWVVYYPTYYYA